MSITSTISSHVGRFAMAATDISNLPAEGIMASYDVTAGRSFSKEASLGYNGPSAPAA